MDVRKVIITGACVLFALYMLLSLFNNGIEVGGERHNIFAWVDVILAVGTAYIIMRYGIQIVNNI